MELPPFLLDHWLAAYEFASPPIRFNLAASTGPRWSVGDILSIGGSRTTIDDVAVSYAPAEGQRALREAIGGFHGVDPDWVVATTGASEAISILFCLASRPNGNVVLPSPAFPAFAAMASAWGLGVRDYVLESGTGYRQAAADVAKAADADTVLALVNTPHNPAGSVMERDQIAALADDLAARRIPLIVDEVYHPLYFGSAQDSAASIDNVIAMSDLSKALSLPGLRIGWIIDSDAERRKRLIDARSYFTISGSPVTETIAARALRHHRKLTDRLSEVAGRNLSLLKSFMAEVSDTLAWVEPAGGTVSFPWFRDGRNSRPFCEALASRGVLVAPGDCFGKPEHMRVGFGAQADGFDEALAIFGRVLRELG